MCSDYGSSNIYNQFRGSIYGLAVGDALGMPLEFKERTVGSPVSVMLDSEERGLSAGTWTDDTSMALCLAESLIACSGFDPSDQLDRYLKWFDYGYMSSNGQCLDIGQSIRLALNTYRSTNDPLGGPTKKEYSGNGSVMRIAPVALYYYDKNSELKNYAALSSMTTHGSEVAIDTCIYVARVIQRALQRYSKKELAIDDPLIYSSKEVQQLANGSYLNREYHEITGSGFAPDSVASAMWCFIHTDSFKDAVVKAVNLGGDADTIGAITGQIAGAYYGYKQIPQEWIGALAKENLIESIVEGLYLSKFTGYEKCERKVDMQPPQGIFKKLITSISW